MKTNIHTILDKFRNTSHSERDKGDRFERLMQLYIRTKNHDVKNTKQ